MIFDIYTKDVELKLKSGNSVTLKIRPLSGRFLPKLFSVASKFQGKSEDEVSAIFSDEKSIADLHLLILETLKKSYPKEDVEALDEFASQNLFSLLEAVIEVNIGNQE